VPTYSGSLLNQDIDGARTGTVGNQHVKHLVVAAHQPRGQYRNLTDTKDIQGAQTGTLKKGIQTNRHLNPLVPDYKVPGHLQDLEWVALSNNGRPEGTQPRPASKPQAPTGLTLPPLSPAAQHLFESQLVSPDAPPAGGLHPEQPAVAAETVLPEQLQPREQLSRKQSDHSRLGDKAKTPTNSAPQSAGPGKPLPRQGSSQSASQSKPLHKRIDREEFMRDAQSFYGVGGGEEPASKISKLVEQLEAQKKVMGKLDRKMNDVYAQSKM